MYVRCVSLPPKVFMPIILRGLWCVKSKTRAGRRHTASDELMLPAHNVRALPARRPMES